MARRNNGVMGVKEGLSGILFSILVRNFFRPRHESYKWSGLETFLSITKEFEALAFLYFFCIVRFGIMNEKKLSMQKYISSILHQGKSSVAAYDFRSLYF